MNSLLTATQSSIETYGGQGAVAVQEQGGTLPFTGLDIGLLVASALVMLLIGVIMAKLVRTDG